MRWQAKRGPDLPGNEVSRRLRAFERAALGGLVEPIEEPSGPRDLTGVGLILREEIRQLQDSKAKAGAAGREGVASHRGSDLETVVRLYRRIFPRVAVLCPLCGEEWEGPSGAQKCPDADCPSGGMTP